MIAERYVRARSPKNKEKILLFKQDLGMSKKTKVMKLGDGIRHDMAVYLWFKQKGMEGVPISGKQFSCIRRCMVNNQTFLGALDGSGCFVRDMEFAICRFKVILSPPLLDLLKNSSLVNL